MFIIISVLVYCENIFTNWSKNNRVAKMDINHTNSFKISFINPLLYPTIPDISSIAIIHKSKIPNFISKTSIIKKSNYHFL